MRQCAGKLNTGRSGPYNDVIEIRALLVNQLLVQVSFEAGYLVLGLDTVR
jgi:hypothetical protein